MRFVVLAGVAKGDREACRWGDAAADARKKEKVEISAGEGE
jgi:hypothetical protein